jgi:NAD(P)-dependent dehydrogenase (short-subunit alcohol dehydrogenase family)
MTNDKPLTGKMAVVTGGNRGIGLATARRFARAGCNVAITGRDRQALEEAASHLCSLGVEVLSAECDQRNAESVEVFFERVRREFGRVDILFNNAGISHPNAPVDRLAIEDWIRVIETNLTGLFLATRAALPLIPRGGTIVNNLSVAAKGSFPGASAYDASKHGALGFTNTLRMDVRERGIRVIALLPGPTDTDIWNQFWADAPRERMMSPESVASAVLHAVTLPENATVEEIVLAPTAGSL